uniref:Ig-like domain-containing protein n=1 Tax=Scophthalmus maximus TaxID=52904 RepID=A0A8D3AW71_SCOMX
DYLFLLIVLLNFVYCFFNNTTTYLVIFFPIFIVYLLISLQLTILVHNCPPFVLPINRHLLSVKIGDNMTFLISTFYVFNIKTTFNHELKNNPRFSLTPENGTFHLAISNLHLSDSAFADGIAVSVESSGLNIQALVHHWASETVQPGGSVTLSCTVHTGTCDREHNVYWFKNSEESHPGLINSRGDGDDQCERKPNTQTHTCVYNLSMKSLNLSHGGPDNCAVASCGHALFGNGTNHEVKPHSPRVLFLERRSDSRHHPDCFTCSLSVQDNQEELLPACR